MKALVFVIPWLLLAMPAMSSGSACTVLDNFDGSALLHREFQLHQPAAAVNLLPLDPSKAFTVLTERVVQRASEHLQGFEAKLQAEHDGIGSLRKYMEEAQGSFGKAGTLFSDLRGMLPGGKASNEDRQVMVTLAGLLREKAFAKALLTSVLELKQAVVSYYSRTDKKVSELLRSSANSTEKELPQLINQFFLAQRQIVTSLVEKLQGSFEKALLALPDEQSYLAKAAGLLLTQAANYTKEYVARTVKNVTDTNGLHFCGNVDTMLMDEVLPMVNDTLQAMPELQAFVESQVPEAKKDVSQMAKTLLDMSKSSLASLKKQGRTWTDKICSLIAAVSPAS